MNVSDERIELCIDALTADVADMYATENGIGITEALRKLITTKTYDLLFDPKSFLYLESAGYVYDMLQDELAENWRRWAEV